MSEQLQNKAVEILTAMQTATEKAGSFAMEQLPDIAQSYIVYGRASTPLYMVLALLCFMCVGLLIKFTYTRSKGKDFITEEWLGTWVLSLILLPVGTGLLAHLNDFLLVWFAPKVWLIKELATLLK